MLFNRHSDLEGQHAFLSASKYHWINYDEEKLTRVFTARMASRRGTELHEFALNAIRLGIKLPKSARTLHLYVNDAIGYRMRPEQLLHYSDNAFGTADAISFRRNKLRIHDLKTGLHPCSIHQLEVYAALFCLEYRYNPEDISIELRIYQNDSVDIYEGDPTVIRFIMDKIIAFDKQLKELRLEALS